MFPFETASIDWETKTEESNPMVIVHLVYSDVLSV